MTGYLLFSVLCILLTLIALGFIIGGLVKGYKKVWGIALGAFVFLSIVSVYSLVLYGKKTIDYLGSEEFHEQTKKTGNNLGAQVGNTVSGFSEGLESSLDEQTIIKLANKGGIILGSGVDAISDGLDETLGKQKIFPSENIEEKGIKIGRAQWVEGKSKYNLNLYLEFKKDFNEQIKLTAYDKEGLKIDNSEIEANYKKGDEKVNTFGFDYLNGGQAEYFILSAIK